MKAGIWVLAAALALSGCATVINGTTQSVKVDVKSAKDGSLIQGGECKLVGDGAAAVAPGGAAVVNRDNLDMDVTCTHPTEPQARGRLVSRFSLAVLGNIFLGGIIGFIVDYGTGSAYNYPSWVQLVAGKTLTFDRSVEIDGQPMVGVEVATSAAVAASGAK